MDTLVFLLIGYPVFVWVLVYGIPWMRENWNVPGPDMEDSGGLEYYSSWAKKLKGVGVLFVGMGLMFVLIQSLGESGLGGVLSVVAIGFFGAISYHFLMDIIR